MIRRSKRRRAALVTGLTALGVLGMAATANADVTGTVTTLGGATVDDARVVLTDANGRTNSTSTDTGGAYSFATSRISRMAPPFTVTASKSDECRTVGTWEERTATSAPGSGADGAQINPTLDLRTVCAVRYQTSTMPESTSYVDPTIGVIVASPGGVANLQLPLVPRSANSIVVALPDGTPIGQGADRSALSITAPEYNGPIVAHWSTATGASGAHTAATLQAGPRPGAPPALGKYDLAAIIDLSGSMSGNDYENRRLDATHLLIELASPGDRLLGVGFDDDVRPVFPRTTITTPASRRNLRATARQNIGNFGGTNYDVGFAQAYAELTADPLQPAVPKGAIFLTDGGHNAGAYQNTHLKFAHNGTNVSWPVCVVQLGTSFNPADTVRLRRIASDTGGRFLKAPNNAQLESLYFQCRGTSTGAQTLVKKTNVFKVGQKRTFTSRVKKKQAKATFFVSWGDGKYRLQLRQPGRKKAYTRTTGKNVRLVKGRTFQYFQVTNPKAGKWRLQVTRLKTGEMTDKATTTINVQRKKGKR